MRSTMLYAFGWGFICFGTGAFFSENRHLTGHCLQLGMTFIIAGKVFE